MKYSQWLSECLIALTMITLWLIIITEVNLTTNHKNELSFSFETMVYSGCQSRTEPEKRSNRSHYN